MFKKISYSTQKSDTCLIYKMLGRRKKLSVMIFESPQVLKYFFKISSFAFEGQSVIRFGGHWMSLFHFELPKKP